MNGTAGCEANRASFIKSVVTQLQSIRPPCWINLRQQSPLPTDIEQFEGLLFMKKQHREGQALPGGNFGATFQSALEIGLATPRTHEAYKLKGGVAPHAKYNKRYFDIIIADDFDRFLSSGGRLRCSLAASRGRFAGSAPPSRSLL